jgi:hypothetical protein
MDHTEIDEKIDSHYQSVFKRCPCCETVWTSRGSFLDDPDVSLIGYQAGFKNLTKGLFYFNHSCKSTMTIYVQDFEELYGGPVYSERKTLLDECPGHCLYKEDLDPCPEECECAYVREVVQIIKNWEKG